MGRKRSRKTLPIFYINQPQLDFPQPDMQRDFLYKNTEDRKESSQNPVMDQMKTESSLKKEEMVETEAETKIVTESKTETESETNKKKSFSEYTLEEKIRHLKLVPASVVKVKYEFITHTGSYKGFFIEMKDGVLLVHSIVPRKKNVTISEQDLIDIKRAGL
ncbi:CotO family spore coat protein [Mesobacillus subterraneus]|uniref:Spore coat protein CotO n=1 Tax=Mesobacillus subterraneus TaxID=285983 RepID=A0A3R9F5H6_9BACI|nr:CotO family spore coat protein [Mesobacillus subterraneus]RSD29429.1 hypothetical protein EJA10_01940 [Mesobacillus subterraneus]